MRINGLNSAQDNQLQTKTQSSDDSSKVLTQNVGQDAGSIKIQNDSLSKTKYQKDEMPISEKTVIDAIEKANKAIEGPNRKLQFSIDRPTHEIVVKVINSDTGELIREIPSEKILDMVAKMQEAAGTSGMAGMLVDQKV